MSVETPLAWCSTTHTVYVSEMTTALFGVLEKKRIIWPGYWAILNDAAESTAKHVSTA